MWVDVGTGTGAFDMAVNVGTCTCAFDVAVIRVLPPPLLLGVCSVRLLVRTISLQQEPLEAPITPVACSQSRYYGCGRYGK